MADQDARAALQRAAEALSRSARSHKQLEFRHRKQARRLLRDLDELRQAAAAYGIDIQIIEPDTAEEAKS